MAGHTVGALQCGMARATTGGRTPVGGRRRSCRRSLPALLALAVLVPLPASAASDLDAWRSARQVHLAQSAALVVAAQDLVDAGGAGEVRELRQVLSEAVAALDALEVHECFRVWWSYVRTSYVLYDQALIGVEAADIGRVQIATASSTYLAALAAATPVDCTGDRGAISSSPSSPAWGGSLLV